MHVCVSVCLSVKSHLTSGASVRPENTVAYSAGNGGQKICGGFFETAPFKSYGVKRKRKSQLLIRSSLPAIRYSCSVYSEAPLCMYLCNALFSFLVLTHLFLYHMYVH